MWLSAPPKSTIDLACAAESANFTLLFIEPPLGSLLGGASANSRALTFTCRSHPITVIGKPITVIGTVIGTVIIHSPPEAQRLSALVSRLAADHGRATSCKQEPRGGSRRESTGCVEPADERLHCASLQEPRRSQGPDGAWRSPPISRPLADAGLRSAALAQRGARRPVFEQVLLHQITPVLARPLRPPRRRASP